MREIRFRGKRLDNGEWVYGNLVVSATGKTYIIPNDVVSVNFAHIEVDPKTVGQYTGMIDQNGKEIYEGDILESNHKLFRFEVIWSEDWAMFTVKGDSVEALIRWATYCEVIGNIYENPELLKGEETA